MTDLERYRDLFVEEAREHLSALQEGLLALGTGSRGSVDALFRAAHSIKGSAATVGLDDVARLAHALEDHLDRIRRGGPVDETATDRLVEATDVLTAAVEAIATRQDPVGLDAATTALRAALPSADETREAAPARVPPDLRAAYEKADPASRLLLALQISADCIAPRARLMVVERAIAQVGRLVTVDPPQERWRDLAPKTAHVAHLVLETERPDDQVRERLVGVPDVDHCVVVAARQAAPPGAPAVPTRSELSTVSLQVRPAPTLRVRSEDIDRLVGLMGEVRIAQTRLDRRLREFAADGLPYPLTETLHQLGLGIRGIYQDLLDIRTVSVALLLDRFPRFARDLARSLGKEVDVVLEGRETTLDRSVIEVLADPLMHLVKNALDHGIEGPEERRAAGKPPRGTIHIAVLRNPGGIQVLFEDDGRGIDLASVREKAVARGLVTADRAERLGADETLMLLATPGFSTAPAVTELSGRGVGLDVVKTGIERVGGSMRLSSEPGAGTKVRMTLPPSLAILEALEVEADGDVWYLPIDTVATSLGLTPEAAAHGVLEPGAAVDAGGPAALLLWGRGDGEDRPVPVLPLARLLGHGDRARYGPRPGSMRARTAGASGAGIEPGGEIPAVVVERHGARLALVVDRIGAIREVVVKRLQVPGLETPLVAGATITSDGDVALILDAAAALKQARGWTPLP